MDIWTAGLVNEGLLCSASYWRFIRFKEGINFTRANHCLANLPCVCVYMTVFNTFDAFGVFAFQWLNFLELYVGYCIHDAVCVYCMCVNMFLIVFCAMFLIGHLKWFEHNPNA